MQKTHLIVFLYCLLTSTILRHALSNPLPPSYNSPIVSPNSNLSLKQTNPSEKECNITEFQPVVNLVLVGSPFKKSYSLSFLPCEDNVDVSALQGTYQPDQENEVVKDVKIFEGDSFQDGSIVSKVEIEFSGLPGNSHINITFELGLSKVIKVLKFEVVGVTVYQTIGNGDLEIFSGATDAELDHSDTVGDRMIFQSAAYEGAKGPGLNSLSLEELGFSIPSDVPIKWTPDCSLTVRDSTDVSENCALAFSSDFKKLYIYYPSQLSSVHPARINITWEGLKEFQQNAEAGTGITEGEADDEFDDILTFLQLSRTKKRSSRLIIIIVVVVVVSLIILAIIVYRFCFYKKSKRPVEKTPKLKFSSPNLEHWLRADIASLRGTTGRTMGVLEDPLTEGEYQIPTGYESRYDASHNKYNPGMAGDFAQGTHHQQQQHQHQQFETENDETFATADPPDMVPPTERYSADKAVTKLVLPRDVERGVELESSTDGGSERDIGEVDKSSEGEHLPDEIGQSSQTRATEQDDDGETGMSSRTDGETEGTGTVVVGDEEDSMNRTAIGSAIDRVKQLDMLLGPATRGLVGIHGEPLHGAGPSTRTDEPESRRGPDGQSMTLSILS